MNDTQIRAQLSEILKSIENGNTAAGLYNDAGVGYYLIGEYEKSTQYLTKAVELNRSASYLFNLANTYSELNQIDLAIDMYLQVLEIDPAHIGSLNNLADEYERIGNVDKAHKLFHHIMFIQPDEPLSHFNLGNFFIRQNQHIEAAKCYEKALEKDPGFTDAYYTIAWILYTSKAYKESKKYVEKGLKTDKNHPELMELAQKLNLLVNRL